MSRPLYEIAAEIRKDWRNISRPARPYRDAMADLTSISDYFYADPGREIVARFLCNASSWRGETARRIKAELKALSR